MTILVSDNVYSVYIPCIHAYFAHLFDLQIKITHISLNFQNPSHWKLQNGQTCTALPSVAVEELQATAAQENRHFDRNLSSGPLRFDLDFHPPKGHGHRYWPELQLYGVHGGQAALLWVNFLWLLFCLCIL